MDERDWDEIWADMDGTGRPDPLIDEFAEPSGRSLDLGCGLGENVMALAAAGWDAHGVDGSPVAVAKATEIARALDLSARFTVADLADGASGSDFDLITMFYVHLQTDAHASLLGTMQEHSTPTERFSTSATMRTLSPATMAGWVSSLMRTTTIRTPLAATAITRATRTSGPIGKRVVPTGLPRC